MKTWLGTLNKGYNYLLYACAKRLNDGEQEGRNLRSNQDLRSARGREKDDKADIALSEKRLRLDV